MLEFVSYEFERPSIDVEECRQRDMTYAAPLKVKLRLIVFEADPDTQAQVGQGHQGAGRLHGRHAAHDHERHLRRQWHRARHRLADAPLAGRLLRPRQGQDACVGQAAVCRPHHPLPRLVAGLRVRRQGHRVRPHRPSPQAPVTTLLYALGMDGEEILSTFYKTVPQKPQGRLGHVPFDPQRCAA
jgi:DNA-directed RNA polymerase subunit beta